MAVDSIQALGSSAATTPTSVGDRSDRVAAEARRILLENKITGSNAMRVQMMLTTAQQSQNNGDSFEAQRIARQALREARSLADNVSIPQRPDPANENSQVPTSPQEEDALEEERSDDTTYQDSSSDSGISFQYAQPIDNVQAPFAVRQHELSHIRRETSDAILNGQRVLTSVRLLSSIDPSTGEAIVGGGRAHVVIFPKYETNPLHGTSLDIRG